MSYTTLMVHLELGCSNAGLLQIAGDLAERFHAGVIGIAACHPVQMVYADGYVSGNLIEYDREEIGREIKAAEAEFRSVLQTRMSKLDWRSTTMFEVLADYLVREARSADLVITCAAASDLFIASRLVNTSDFLMRVGCPVLIVPTSADKVELERVMIGWKDARETRRAVADALPLLKQAAHVAVVEITAEKNLAAVRARFEDIVGWLHSHGIKAQAHTSPSTGDDATALYAIAQDQGADVIVAGAYGHSRLRERVLGGVTRDLLLSTNRCSLLSH